MENNEIMVNEIAEVEATEVQKEESGSVLGLVIGGLAVAGIGFVLGRIAGKRHAKKKAAKAQAEAEEEVEVEAEEVE